MSSKESSQMHNNLLQDSQLAVLTVSLLKELRREQESNPKYIIMNERILAIQFELNNVLQQNDNLVMDNSNLQLACSELANNIQKKIIEYSNSLAQKFDDHSKKSELQMLNLISRINNIKNSYNEKLEKKQLDIESLSEDNEVLFRQINENNQKYQKVLNQKEDEITNLKEIIDNCQEQINQLNQEKNKFDEEYNEVQQKLFSEVNKTEKLSSILSNLKDSTENQKTELATNIEKKNEEINRLQDQINNYKTEIEQLKTNENEIKQQLENERKFYIEQQLSGENQSKEVLKSIEDSKNQIQNELDLKNKEIESLKELQNNLTSEIESLKNANKDKEELENNFKSISDENENLKQKLELLNQSQIIQNKTILELTIANKELNEKAQDSAKDYSLKIKEIEQKNKEEKESKNQLYENKINEMNLESDIKQNEIDSLKIEINNLKNELNKSNDLNINLSNELGKIKNENERLTLDSNKLTELTNEVEQIRKNYDSTLRELESYKVNVLILTDQKESITTESQENKNKINELTQARQQLEKQLETLNDNLKRKEAEIQNKDVEINLLRSSSETRKSKINEQLIQSNKEINRLNSELNRLQKVEAELQEKQNLLEQKANIEIQNQQLSEQNRVLLSDHRELISIAGEFNIEIYDLKKFIQYTKSENIKLSQIAEENAKSINDLQNALKETEATASKQMTEYENIVENLNTSHITEIERLKNIYNQNVDQLKKSNQELNEKNENYQRELINLNGKLNILSESINNNSTNNEEKIALMRQLDERNKENQNLQELVRTLQEEKETNGRLSFIEQERVNNIEVDRLTNEINELKQNHQNQIEEMQDRLNGISLKNEEIEYRNNELEKAFTAANDENVELKSQVNDAQSFLSIIGPLNGEIFDLRSNLQVSAARVRQMKKDNRSLKFEVQRLNNEIIYLNSTLDEKKNTVTSLQQKQAELERASNTKVTELKSGISKIFEELEERKKHDEDLARIEQEKHQMLKDIGVFEEQIYELNKQSNLSFKTISNLRNEIIGYLNNIERMKIEAQNADENIANLVQQVSQAREEGEKVKKINNLMNSKLGQLDDVNNSLKDRINTLENLNSSLRKEKERLAMMNKELDSRVQMSSKEKEIIMKRLDQKQEVNDAIEELHSRLNSTLTKNDELQKEISLAKDENKRLLEIIDKSTSDQTTIEKLQLEKLELTSKVSLLEGQLQLRAVKMKDSDIAELERRIQELQKYKDSANHLQEKVSKLEKENDELRSERDALDLKSSELEANTASSAELKSALQKCEELENEVRNRESEIDKIRTERNVIDLKYEELLHELEDKKNQISTIESENLIMKKNEENLKKDLAESKIESTKASTENLKEKREIISLKTRISELEAITSSIRQEKEKLEETNKRQCEELESLSQRVFNLSTSSSNIVTNNSNPNTKSPYKMISDKSKEIKILEDQLRNESAAHLNTKREMDKQSNAIKEAERRLRNAKTDLEGLIKSLTSIFMCKPNIASIVAEAARCKGQSQYVGSLSEKLKKVQNDALIARREPNYLKQKLHDTNMLLDIEKKKNFVMTANTEYNNIIQPETQENQENEILLPVINKCEICLKNFLNILLDSRDISNDIQIATSNLIYRAEMPKDRDFFDETSWTSLAQAITVSFYKYKQQFLRTQLFAENINKKIFAGMNTINQNVDNMQKRISMLSMKSRDRSFIQTRNPKIENNKDNNAFVSHIPRMSTSSLNARQSRTPIQSAFINSSVDSQTPSKSNWKSNKTPTNLQKKQETPFRTPLGDLSNSTMNISFGNETPKIAMHRNTMSKIPIHLMPSGVLPPKSRNYH